MFVYTTCLWVARSGYQILWSCLICMLGTRLGTSEGQQLLTVKQTVQLLTQYLNLIF